MAGPLAQLSLQKYQASYPTWWWGQRWFSVGKGHEGLVILEEQFVIAFANALQLRPLELNRLGLLTIRAWENAHHGGYGGLDNRVLQGPVSSWGLC